MRGRTPDFVEAWLPRWECKTDDTDTSYAPLAGVAQALQKPDDALVDALSSVLNIDRYITFWALEALVNHLDGYSADRNNFYVYFDPTDAGRAVFIPWGADKTFLSSFSHRWVSDSRSATAALPHTSHSNSHGK